MEVRYNVKSSFKSDMTNKEIKDIVCNKLINIIIALENNKKHLKSS